MRLIDTSTGHLAEFSSSPPRYAILSHTWDIEEITFQDLCSQNPCNSKKGYDKLKNFIELAKKSRHQYVWADTCCIDKTSSAELSEAINSMFQWYRKATVCFVYLSDVSTRSQGRSRNERTTWTDAVLLEKLSNSRWFRRSWTLQELIAPVSVEFYSQEWDYVGTKIDLCRFLNRITRISNGVLVEINGYKQASVAQKMSWAAEREATREEDVSYSLFGIFDVNMAPLYGEGHERAFRRLQEEIIRTCTDETILIWSMPFGNSEICRPVLAPSPQCFWAGTNVVHFLSPWAFEVDHMSVTPWGVRMEAPIIRTDNTRMQVILSSRYVGNFKGPLAIWVTRLNTNEKSPVVICQKEDQDAVIVTGLRTLTLLQLPRCKIHIIHHPSVLNNRGRGLGTNELLPRLWVRSVGAGLVLEEVRPREAWNPELQIFEKSQRSVTELRKRVLVVKDQVESPKHHVINAFFQVIQDTCYVGVSAQPVPTTQTAADAADMGLQRARGSEEFHKFDQTNIYASPTARAHSQTEDSHIEVKIYLDYILGELVHIVDISRLP